MIKDIGAEVSEGRLTFTIDIKDIPSVHRLLTAATNLTTEQPDGTYCSCGQLTEHEPRCTELSEAIKEIKG